MASISKTVRPKRSNNNTVSPSGYGLTVGRGTPSATGVSGGVGTVLLSSDWSVGTGTSDAIIREDGAAHPWDAIGYSSTKRLDVISAAGLGFPAGMSNCLRALSPAGTQNFTQVQKFWSAPAIGESLYYRWYFRQGMTDAVGAQSDSGNHTAESSIAPGSFGSDGGWTFAWGNRTDGTFQFFFEVQPYANTYKLSAGTNLYTSPVYLSKDTTYRFEWKIARVATTTASFEFKIFDEAVSATVALYDSANTSGYDWNAGPLTTGTIASGYASALPLPANSFTNIELGPNGSGWSLSSNQYNYYGGVRVTRGGSWIGAYVPGEE